MSSCRTWCAGESTVLARGALVNVQLLEEQVVDSAVLRFPKAVTHFSPGSYDSRPKQTTSFPNVFIAGDWVKDVPHGSNGLSQVCTSETLPFSFLSPPGGIFNVQAASHIWWNHFQGLKCVVWMYSNGHHFFFLHHYGFGNQQSTCPSA